MPSANAPPGVRSFTPEEARAAIPHLRPLLAQLRDAFHEYRFARQQVEELVGLHGHEALDDPDHPDHDDALRFRARADEEGGRVEALVEAIGELGADVKDPLLGLVDFTHVRPDGTVVLLCFRDDEPTLGYWHPVDAGFAGRRPLEELGSDPR